MKGLSTPSEDKQSSEHPANAGTSPFPHPLRRVGVITTGALLFIAAGAGLVSAKTGSESQPAAEQTKPQSSIKLQSSQPNDQTTPAKAAPPTGNGAHVHTQVTTINGDTAVTVNGQPVTPAADGSINKTITTDDGSTVHIDVSQSSSDGAAGSASASVNSSNSSSSWSVSSDSSGGNSSN